MMLHFETENRIDGIWKNKRRASVRSNIFTLCTFPCNNICMSIGQELFEKYISDDQVLNDIN